MITMIVLSQQNYNQSSKCGVFLHGTRGDDTVWWETQQDQNHVVKTAWGHHGKPQTFANLVVVIYSINYHSWFIFLVLLEKIWRNHYHKYHSCYYYRYRYHDDNHYTIW